MNWTDEYRLRVRMATGCPYCGSPVNARCITPDGTPRVSNHRERVELSGVEGGNAWQARKAKATAAKRARGRVGS